MLGLWVGAAGMVRDCSSTVQKRRQALHGQVGFIGHDARIVCRAAVWHILAKAPFSTTIPRLETERLLLREYQQSDFEDFAAFFARPRSRSSAG